jgi:hypothetical protein
MMLQIDHFIPAREPAREVPLQRFLQPLPADVVGRYIAAYTAPGDLILDPMAQTTTLPETATRQDRKAIAANFNPIDSLVVEAMLTLPNPEEIDAATTQLGDSPKRGVPLRDHINQLYESSCQRCSNPVFVERFVWDGEKDRPVEKYYRCPRCKAEGLFPAEDSDLALSQGIEGQGVHYWYLLERLAQPHDPERRLAKELLELYTPRSLYALADISMKMESLFADPPLRLALQLILLHCLDTCCKLASGPAPRPTALRLHPPSTFVESNVWVAFEEAYRLVRRLAPAAGVKLTSDLQDLVAGGGNPALVLTEPLRGLSAMLPPATVSLVVSAPRAYYRPFWALSYLWSGWLWGRQRAATLTPLLRRRIMGWSWYRRTLAAALRSLHRPLHPQGRMVFLLEDGDLTHVTNLILASVAGKFKLERVLYQPRDAQPPRQPMHGVAGGYRLTFARDDASPPEPQEPSPDELAPVLQRAALRAIREVLRERGEALHLSWLHSAVYTRWARDGLLRQAVTLDNELSVADFLTQQLEAALEEALQTQSLDLLPVAPDDPEGAQLWWLAGKGYPSRPLAERVEHEVREALREAPDLPPELFEDHIYSRFPGLFTPGPGLLENLLRSYGFRDEDSGPWRLRPEDDPDRLVRERSDAQTLLATVGHDLGYEVTAVAVHPAGTHPGSPGQANHLPRGIDVVWGEDEGTPLCLFAVKYTTELGDVLGARTVGGNEDEWYIVIVERRLDLLSFRMETELLLRRALAAGKWRFIKLGHLRQLAARKSINRGDLADIVGLHPSIERPDSQLPLFS